MSAPSSERRAVVVGAGLTGLAAAWRLLQDGWQTTLVEASSRLGGCMETVYLDGYTVETGPNTVLADPIFDTLHEVASAAFGAGRRPLEAPILAAAASRRRWVVFEGQLQALPASPPALLTTPLLSLGAKLRLAGEPWRRGQPDPRESVADFFDRRLGPEVRQRVGDAMVTGIYAGDPEELAVGAALPKIHSLEQEAGSLIRGVRARRRAAKRSGQALLVRRILGFPSGFGPWSEALGDTFRRAGGTILRESPATAAHRSSADSANAAFEIEVQGSTSPLLAHRLLLALPERPARRLLRPLATAAGHEELPGLLPTAPVAVLSLGVDASTIRHPLDGFGFLAPHGEGRDILGCLFPATLFPSRAPHGRALLTVMIGGRRRPELVGRSDADLVTLARRELEALLHLPTTAPHDFALIRRWVPGIPQPTAAWFSTQKAYDQLEARLPGLSILGGWRRGVSLPDCARGGWEGAGGS